MIRHAIRSGSFFDSGVKKLETAFSEVRRLSVRSLRKHRPTLLVVVDSTLRFFRGGGDKDAFLFPLAG